MKRIYRFTFLILCACICLGVLSGTHAAAGRLKLIPGGMNFGVKFFTDGLLVVGTADVTTSAGLCSPAKDCGIKVKETIISADGKKLSASEELLRAVDQSGGKEMVLTVKNTEGAERQVKVTPVLSSETGKWCIGVWVRDSTAGIGTVTYINGFTGDFGGLGHGICDVDTGALMPVGKAYVVDVNITAIDKGDTRVPGELKGTFGKETRGEIFKNTQTGVYGNFSTLPASLRQPIEVAKKKEVTEGKATVLCQINGKVGEYDIEIVKVYKDSGETKNFLIRVTDPELLKATGGIVQGMSGSPIIQNGRLAGAVTHVLVNDHTKGYGIFIENMLGAQ
ncbi:MAG: SpoIVB peptidase [Clostridia bacterium]|nr:SpoIVB peptidase [Clostridia bacterium]